MIERLQRALEHIEALPLEAQEEIAERIEEWIGPQIQPNGAQGAAAIRRIDMPEFPDDVDAMFDALDRIRHESTPTPPIDLADIDHSS